MFCTRSGKMIPLAFKNDTIGKQFKISKSNWLQ